jgi:hypothetical protein
MPANIGNQNPGIARSSLQDPLRKLGPANTVRVIGPTIPANIAPATGVPATVAGGTGTGANADIFYYTAPASIENELIVYGEGSAGHRFRGQIIGRKELHGTGAGVETLPRVLGTFEGTLGTRAGVAGMGIGTGERFADSITVVADYTPGSGLRVGAVGSGIATLAYDARGNHWVGVELVGGTGGANGTGTGAASLNGLWCGL